MYRERKISLVIPAYNEERLIIPTLLNVPSLVDRIFVVDDCSTDSLPRKVSLQSEKDPRIEFIRHDRNRGVGQAIITGYKRSLEGGFDIAVVAGGDNQMPLGEMPNLLDPIIDGKTDYVKGNRFLIEENVFENMPKIRQFGNAIITLLTKMASGYYRIYDVVDGYTAISSKALRMINWDKAWKGYGYPMDFLIRLNTYGLRVTDVPRTEIYLKGEKQSQIKGFAYALKVSPMLFKGFIWRIFKKYIFRDFHPLVFFYIGGLLSLPLGVLLGLYLLYLQITGFGVSGPRAILCALLIISGLQLLFFAILFDMYESDK
ncbi:MAG: glycosyltransferase family 2 protein [Elusimicrobia bacterium]|nr:glycosyltransferase family 2 protein [Elusimicrobiota bacterium]